MQAAHMICLNRRRASYVGVQLPACTGCTLASRWISPQVGRHYAQKQCEGLRVKGVAARTGLKSPASGPHQAGLRIRE